MDKFLERHKLHKLTQDRIEKCEDIFNKRLVIFKKLHKKKSLGLDGCTGEFYQTFTKELIPIIQSSKTYKRILPNLFYETNMILVPKPDKNIRRKTQSNIS